MYNTNIKYIIIISSPNVTFKIVEIKLLSRIAKVYLR